MADSGGTYNRRLILLELSMALSRIALQAVCQYTQLNTALPCLGIDLDIQMVETGTIRIHRPAMLS
ncbi:MAG: hypothetical protein K9K30_12435 [Burkholderiaceae bacterium]|nr:hypothetical protein [Sulfuritalea sp.]MCF8176038.1 hypothetical protein [Burkholderiaceae bacterium]